LTIKRDIETTTLFRDEGIIIKKVGLVKNYKALFIYPQ